MESAKSPDEFEAPGGHRGFESHPFRFKEGIEPKVVLLFRQDRQLAASLLYDFRNADY